MNLAIQRTREELIEKFLHNENLGYFSCTIFDHSHRELLSFCNHETWMNHYRQSYCPDPPVKKYILQKLHGIVWWDPDLYDKTTSAFIASRNQMCDTSMICTFVPEGNMGVGAISFGSKYGQEHLVSIIQNRSLEMEQIFQMLLAPEGRQSL